MICAGVDVGSRMLKVVLVDAAAPQADDESRPAVAVVASGVVDEGIDQDAVAWRLVDRLLAEAGLRRDDLRAVVATGYGRKLITAADAAITEVTCQAWGVRHRVPEVRTIIDVGGQDSKLVRLRPDGAVADFVMNDRCAAGTGRFLEVLATRLGVKLTSLGGLVAGSRTPATISSMCVVFAETEIIGLLASGVAPEDIVAGVQASMASRVAAMSGRESDRPDRLHRRRGPGPRHGRRPRSGLGTSRPNRPRAANDLRPGGRNPRRRPAARPRSASLLRRSG